MSDPELPSIESIQANAEGDIDRELLTGTGTGSLLSRGYFNDGPLLTRLITDEQLQYLAENHSSGVEIEWATDTETIAPDGNYRTGVLVTDTATRIVVGRTVGDRVIEIPHRRVTDTRSESSLLRRTLTLTTADATYRVATKKAGDTDAIAAYILDRHAAITESEPEPTQASETTTEQPSDDGVPAGDRPAGEESIADSDEITTTGYWQLPTADALSPLDSELTTSIETARQTLDDNSNPTRNQLIHAHTELCTALEYTTPDQAPIRNVLNDVVDRVETELNDRPTAPRRDARPPIDAGGDPEDDVTATSNPATTEDTVSTAEYVASDPDPATEKTKGPKTETRTNTATTADFQWRASLLRDLQRLDNSQSTAVDRALVSRVSQYEPVDYDSAFESFDAALVEAGITDSATTAQPETQRNAGPDSGNSAAPSASAPAGTENNTIPPNELAELYEAFGMLQAVIDQLGPHLDPQPQSVTQVWYQAVYEHWTGGGPDGAPSYGEQQRERNDFSINDYREQYGDDNRITEFDTIETKPIEDVTHDELGSRDIAVNASGVVPIAPESGTPLPVLVRTDTELDAARNLLTEFPTYPDASISEPTTPSVTALPEGRVDEVSVTVLEKYSGTGSKRDAWLSVRTDAGQRMPLVIWTTHDIDADWEVGASYTLYEARHKQWTSDDGTITHELSSTSDLRVDKQIESRSSGKSESQKTPGSTGTAATDTQSEEPNEDTEQVGIPTNDEDEPDDIVDRLMRDLEL